MTPESKILDFYRSEFVRLKVKPQRSGVALQHAAWMIEECLVMKFPDDMYKINRWIGFVQGVLWKEGIYTIDQMREHVTTAKAAAVAEAETMVTNYWGGARDATV